MAKDDPLLSAAEVAKLLGELRGRPFARTTWTGYVSRGQPADDPAPKPRKRDGVVARGGITSPRWRQSVVVAWNQRVMERKSTTAVKADQPTTE